MLRLEDLDGVKIYQDQDLYCFTSDSVLLSRFATVKKDDVVADFCSGSGVVGFNLYALNKDKIKSVTLFEMQKPLFDLSVKSIEYNSLSNKITAVNSKIQDIGEEYCGKFSLITCNPPYMPENGGEHDKQDFIAICRREITLKLNELIKGISYCLKYGGRTCIVHRADRLTDLLCTMREFNIEPKRLQIVCNGEKEPYLILVEGVKGGKSGMKILSPARN